jgi:hypothetical protein
MKPERYVGRVTDELWTEAWGSSREFLSCLGAHLQSEKEAMAKRFGWETVPVITTPQSSQNQ